MLANWASCDVMVEAIRSTLSRSSRRSAKSLFALATSMVSCVESIARRLQTRV